MASFRNRRRSGGLQLLFKGNIRDFYGRVGGLDMPEAKVPPRSSRPSIREPPGYVDLVKLNDIADTTYVVGPG